MNEMCNVRKAALRMRCECLDLKTSLVKSGSDSKPLSTMREPADATGVALSSISRILDALRDRHCKGKPGLGLVAKDWDPREVRRMVAWLTPKGKEVVSRLLETVAP
jgi:DNA-binding MarR family transcriptional regulator